MTHEYVPNICAQMRKYVPNMRRAGGEYMCEYIIYTTCTCGFTNMYEN